MKKRPKRRKTKTAAQVKKTYRKLGFYKGMTKISDDFNAPLPGELLRAFGGLDAALSPEKATSPLITRRHSFTNGLAECSAATI